MFEDSTFASTGRVKMRSRAGFLWAAAFEATIVLAAVVIPLLYPQALPNLFHTSFLEAPAPPVGETRMPAHQMAPQSRAAVLTFDPFQPPHAIPKGYTLKPQEAPGTINLRDLDASYRPGGGGDNPFGPATPVHVVNPPTPSVVRLPSKIVEGMLLQKTVPNYPQIAIASHTQGTVTLQATISGTGTIENLRVVSGPPMLRQAALDAVSTWRYRPYMLNGKPIEVETTVNVLFKLD